MLEWYIVRILVGRLYKELQVYAQDPKNAGHLADFQLTARGGGGRKKVVSVRKEGEPDIYLQDIKKKLMSTIDRSEET